MGCRWIACVLAGVLAHAVAQQPAPASRAEVRLDFADGQSRFQLGDVIRLSLVFRDPAFPDRRADTPQARPWLPEPGQVAVNSSLYGDLADQVTITPATGWFQWRRTSGHDYMAQTPLDATGVRIPLVLNQGFVFRDPGHYEITVTTRRMGHEAITTNAIAIDLTDRSAEDEAALVKTLDATLAGTKCKAQIDAAEQLAWLPGDDALRSKVKWLLGPDQDIATAMTNGLAATRNQQLQLHLLRAAWADPRHAPDGTLQWALQRAERFARGLTEPGWQMAVAAPREDDTSRALDAEYRQDLEQVIATLPQRAGDVRRDTAYYLLQNNQLSPDQLARVRPVVLQEFARMEPIAQSMLIETRWSAVKDSSLAPYLKAMIESKARDIDAATAVERLIEIDEPESRPFVVQMVCSTQRGLLLDKLNGVKEDRLPEVDGCLTELLARGERREHDFDWEQAAQRAARFATPAILPRVKAVWVNSSQDPSMLALLLRDAPDEALALLEREPEIQWFPANKVYAALGGKLPPQVLAWLRKPTAPPFADYELAQYGDPADRVLLEARLHKLRSQWQDRQAEIKDAQPNTPAFRAGSAEADLVSCLLGAKAWSLTGEEKQRLTEGCLGEPCKAYAPHNTTAVNN